MSELKPGHLPMDVPPNHCCKCGYMMSDIVVTCEVCGESQPAHTRRPTPPDIMERVDREVAKELLECAESWEPDACILGNVRAEDIALLCRAALSDSTGEG